MPIVDGRYEAKISTTFRSTKEAVEAIKEKIEKSRRVRISGIPMSLLKKLLPVLEGKDVKIILPLGEKAGPELKEVGDLAVTKARIYKDHKGVEANLGSIYFSDRMFSVAWVGEKILETDAMDYDKCVKCMRGMFDVGWRYAEK
ncbi:MAG: hypothetical protein ACYS9T_07940 [Planctomycetota bacterium]|jgi:hypothetical protein